MDHHANRDSGPCGPSAGLARVQGYGPAAVGGRRAAASGSMRVRGGLIAGALLCVAVGAGTVACDEPTSPSAVVTAVRSALSQTTTTATTGTVRYTVRFERPASHYAEVEAVYPARGRAEVDLMMPVWTPGSYLVREYARHVEGITATNLVGTPRRVDRLAKNRLRIRTEGDSHVVLRYRVYGHEPSVRTNYIVAAYAVLAPAATFYGDADHLDAPHLLVLRPSPEWSDVSVALPAAPESDGHTYVAEDFDALVDAPVLLGRLDRRRFSVGATAHELVTVGGESGWDAERAVNDTRRIAEAVIAFWGTVPYQRYLFFNVLNGGRGGLEHKNSTVLMADQWAARDEKAYRRWTGLVTHELFHAWNGKRLRPKSLGPFDYERENYTRALWIVEGFTSYYDNLLRIRAGLLTEKQYLKALSADVERMAKTPGEAVQSLDDASYNAWIKAYRPDENSVNTSVSYYTKGALVAWVLDARIQRATGGAQSLDDVMRIAYSRFSGDTGYTRDEFIAIVTAVGGPDVGDWLDAAAHLARPVDYGPALEWFGLRFEPQTPLPTGDSADDRQKRRDAAWLGVDSKMHEGRLIVDRVVRGGPADKAGVSVGDELIGLGGHRIIDLAGHVARYEPRAVLPLLVARRGALLPLTIEVGTRPRVEWPLEVDPDASADARRRRRTWFGVGQ